MWSSYRGVIQFVGHGSLVENDHKICCINLFSGFVRLPVNWFEILILKMGLIIRGTGNQLVNSERIAGVGKRRVLFEWGSDWK
jgi:hypothetical protein